jgi:ABC-type multidrug transport system ATPase subunit
MMIEPDFDRYALALIHEPALLMLDEPTANLDAEGAAVVKSIVERQRSHGAVLMATNEASETSWADHVCVLGAART